MKTESLTAEELREIIESVGHGTSFSKRVNDVAGRIGISVPTLWRWLRVGLPGRESKLQIKQLRKLK